MGFVLVLLVAGTATAVHMTVAQDVRDATVASACAVTSCSGPGMAAAGWLLALTPLLYGLALYAWWRRVPAAGQLVWIAAGALLFVAAIQFLPRKGGPDLRQLFDGPGSAAFATGMQWGIWAIASAVGVLVVREILSGKVTIPRWVIGVALVACATVTLVATITQA